MCLTYWRGGGAEAPKAPLLESATELRPKQAIARIHIKIQNDKDPFGYLTNICTQYDVHIACMD